MDIRPQSSDELDSQRRVRRDMSNSLKGTLLTVVAGIAWGLSGSQPIRLSVCYSGDQCGNSDGASVCLSCRNFNL